jgi:acyl carrier protein
LTPTDLEVLTVDVSGRIRGFIAEEIMFEERSVALSDDTPLLSGIMDSLGLLQLVAFLEEEFEVEVDDADMTADHFRTVGDIERLVRQKLEQKVAQG